MFDLVVPSVQKAKGLIVHVHIPKSGGTSLNRSLGLYFVNASRLGIEYDQGYKEIAAELQREGKGGIASHWPFGVHQLLNGEVDLITVLRHPLERVPSYHGFIRQQASRGKVSDRNHQSVVAALRNESLEGFVGDDWRVQNGMVRQLCGVGLGYKGPVRREHFEAARKNLNQVRFVGVTPRLGALLAKIGDYLGTKPRTRRDNATSSKSTASQEDKAAIMKWNTWDARLYEVAEKRAP